MVGRLFKLLLSPAIGVRLLFAGAGSSCGEQAARITPPVRVSDVSLLPDPARQPYRVWQQVLCRLGVIIAVAVVIQPALCILPLALKADRQVIGGPLSLAAC